MLSVCLQSLAQSNPFTGTFVNASQTIMVQFKPAGAEYHGLLQVEGGSYAIKVFRDGSNSLNPVNKNLILQGRWQIGNTQYAIQRNKIRCP